MRKSIKSLTVAVLATITLSNCGGKNTPENTTSPKDTIDSLAKQEVALKFETFKSNETFKAGYVSISVSYPTEGPEALVKSIREFINNSLDGTYKGDIGKAQEMLNYYAKSKRDSIDNDFESSEEFEELSQVCSTDSIFVDYEGKNYITIAHVGYEETGGPHGYGHTEGATFSKKDGKRFTKALMTGLNTPEFNEIVKEGLKDYFSQGKSISDADLEDNLMIEDGVDLKHLPLPQAEPYFDNKGIVFGYASYEIACYAAGQPEFVIPFDKAKKFLKAEALEMIE